jgi:methionyl-tRNA synthetase
MNKNFYITTPIYYPNARPHIGSLYSTVLADILARYSKLEKKNVCFLTGLDEHGQKVFGAAEKAGVSPQLFVDQLAIVFESIFKKWNIDYTIFMRTTNDFHKTAVQKWIIKLQEKGLIYKAKYEGWYSVTSESFLLEKDCELKNLEGIPLCPITQKEAIWVSQEAYFFKLSLFEKPILNFFKENPLFITPKERIAEVISFVSGGLKDLCISRLRKDLSWGIAFPNDDNHVVYVWADALNNYITAISYLQNDEIFNKWWPCDVHVMAKDIIRFHAVYWLAFLMAVDLPLPKRELVHGWLLVNNEKMSKSLENVIDPITILEKYDVDSVRYYFSTLSIREDSNFSIDELEQKHNSDLCDTLSNLFQRMLVLSKKKGLLKIDFDFEKLPIEKQDILKKSILIIDEIKKEIYECNMGYLNQLNAFFHQMAPWKENDSNAFSQIMSVIAYGLFQVGVLLFPIMPNKIEILLNSLSIPKQNRFLENIILFNKFTFVLEAPIDYIFTKYAAKVKEVCDENKKELVEKEKAEDNKGISLVTIDEFLKNIILVGQIIKVEDIARSDKLYYLTVDFGQNYGERQIASGIKQFYKKEELINIKTLFSFNLAPRTLCGVISEGMILMTKNEQGPSLIIISDLIFSGVRIG